MKKFVLQNDKTGKLLLTGYKDLEESRYTAGLYDAECYKLIQKLSHSKVVDIYENPNGKDITVEYKSYIIELKNYQRLMRKKLLAPIMDNVRIYYEKQGLIRQQKRTVTRKNKYAKRRLLATGLTALVISGCALGVLHKTSKIDFDDFLISNSDELDDDFISTLDLDVNGETEVTELKTQSTNVASNNVLEIDTPTVNINYEDRSNTVKAFNTKSYYNNLFEKYSNMYGIDPTLAIAVGTQERGIHSEIMDQGGATGLMQVQNSVWRNQNLSAYNFNTKEMETIKVDESRLSDVEYNIKVGCMILQTNLKAMNYNTLAAIQTYNMGYGNMNKILAAYSVDSGKTIEQILDDPTDIGWLKYRNIIKVGDIKYVENVLSWMGNSINLTNKKDDKTEVCCKVQSVEDVKVIR